MKTPSEIRQDLTHLADNEYRRFQSKLMPTVPFEKVLGVRMPRLRVYAKNLSEEEISLFLADLPHRYYDEDNLHGILLSRMKDMNALLPMIEDFLPHIDNWATCDLLRPAVFSKNTDRLDEYIEKWLSSQQLYTVRFAIGLRLSFYLKDHFSPSHLERIAAIESEEYYLEMMVAWYFATALAYRWEEAFPYLLRRRLTPVIHKMTVRKSLESFRITDEQKALLKAL